MTSKQTVAVVTGAARGIGEASALRLAEDGIAVVCVDIDASVSQTAATIREHGGQALHVAVNLSRPDAHELVTQAAVDTFGGIDVYHANAGIQTIAPLEATTHADWDSLLGTNLKAVAFGIAAALPIMRERGGGSIIITASILGVVGDPNMPAYGATKGALRAFCRALASRHGVDNIRVNTVCPGDVETRLVTEFLEAQPDPERARAEILQYYPLRRFAQPRDVANLVAFLASESASYITGTDILIDGGLLALAYPVQFVS